MRGKCCANTRRTRGIVCVDRWCWFEVWIKSVEAAVKLKVRGSHVWIDLLVLLSLTTRVGLAFPSYILRRRGGMLAKILRAINPAVPHI